MSLHTSLRAAGALLGVLALTASLLAAPLAFAAETSGCGGCGTGGDCGSSCCLLLRKMVEQGLVPDGATGDCGHSTEAAESHPHAPTGSVWKAPEGCASDCPGLQAPASSKINPVLEGVAHSPAASAPGLFYTGRTVRVLPAAALPPTPPRGPPALLSIS
jgi:hypothetical protein